MNESQDWSDNHYVEALHSIVDEAISGSQKLFKPLLDRIQNVIGTSEDYATAKDRINQDLLDREFIRSFGQYLYDSHVAADGLGRSFIVRKDAHFSRLHKRASAKHRYGKLFVRDNGMNWYQCTDHVDISFDLIPQEALDYMREKSFWISGIKNQDLLDAIQEKLSNAIRDGTGYKDFVKAVHDTIDSLGYSGPMPYRLDTLFRTNLFGAYSMGQLDQVEQMKDRFPLWRYHAIKDNRTRPMHRDLDGLVFHIGEGPFPPIDFNCRCVGQFIHELETEGITRIVSSDGANSIMQHNQIIRFDQRSAFDKWIGSKKAGLDPSILSAVENEIK